MKKDARFAIGALVYLVLIVVFSLMSQPPPDAKHKAELHAEFCQSTKLGPIVACLLGGEDGVT